MSAPTRRSAPLVVFAPGAGAASTSDWMEGWAPRLAAALAFGGAPAPVVRFDYPYRLRGRSRPDRLPVLVAAHREAIARARDAHPAPDGGERRVVLVGKSMGGRVGCHVAAESPDPAAELGVFALVCLGFPLLGQGDPAKPRDEVLVALRTPVLFVQGTRDPLCPLDALAPVRARMGAPNALHVVETGDHSLEITRTQARIRDQASYDTEAAEAIARFVAEHAAQPSR